MAKDPSTAHRNHPVGGQPGESPGGSNATRNTTTAVRTEPGSDRHISVCAGRRAEAEGFEPPVPLSTLAFKTQGNRVLECAPSCLPASFLLRCVPKHAGYGSRLLHDCYTAVAVRQPVSQWFWTGPGRRGWTSGGTCSGAG